MDTANVWLRGLSNEENPRQKGPTMNQLNSLIDTTPEAMSEEALHSNTDPCGVGRYKVRDYADFMNYINTDEIDDEA